jgi:hypothetical protein
MTMVGLIALAATPAAADAAARYASPTGSGTACTQATPCTLTEAIEGSGVHGGDEVVVLAGTHDLGSDHVVVDKAINVHGARGAPRPTVAGSDFTTIWVAHTGAALRDLEIEGNVTVSLGLAERVYAHSDTSTPCYVNPFSEEEVPLIRDSFCWGPGASARGFTFGIGASTPHTYSAALRNVTAIGGSYGIEAYGAGGPLDMRLDAKNVIAQGDGGYPDVIASASAGGNRAKVTLSHSNYNTEGEFGPGPATVTDPGSGSNQTAVPAFVNPASGNFHQAAASPTIDAGAYASDIGKLDIDKQHRFQGEAPDIGGDEVEGPPQTLITKGPRHRTTSDAARFRFHSSEPGSTLECKLDGHGYRGCHSPRRYRGLDPGRHLFKARATDALDHRDPSPARYHWRIRPD